MLRVNLQLFASKKASVLLRTVEIPEQNDWESSEGTECVFLQGPSSSASAERIHPGHNVGRGGDDTLYAQIEGIVRFERRGKNRRQVSVYAE